MAKSRLCSRAKPARSNTGRASSLASVNRRGIAAAHAGAFVYIPMVSREAHPGALAGRIPDAIRDGRLESRAGLALTADNSHAMLCGNPQMVDDVQKALEARGMRRHRRREPGQVTVETYW